MNARMWLLLLAGLAVGVGQPMQGTYVVSLAGGGDFTSFSQAVGALLARGMSGAVVFEGTEGTYAEGMLDLRGINTSGKTLTFRAKAGHRVTIDGLGAAAIFFADFNYGATHNVKVEGLRLTNSSTGGWPVYAVNRLNGWRISDCEFDTPSGPWFNGSYDSVVGCKLRLTGNNGVYLYSSSNCWVVNNFVSGVRMSGIYFNSASGNMVCNNTVITDSTAANAMGLYQNQSSNTFYNNVVVASSYCLYTGSQPAYSDFNCWYRHSGDSRLFYLSNVGAMGLLNWRSRSGNRLDMNSMEADPLVVDRVNDLHLQPASPCIDAGMTVAGVTTDIDGQPRTVPYDIGADEYHPVGLADNSRYQILDGRLQIEPNPACGQVAIRLPPTAGCSELRLYDAAGNCVLTRSFGRLTTGSLTLDLRGIAAGVYLVRLASGPYSNKLIVR
ncbi:MAG: NosD domain-containing protein [candidate division WOR-3 bacterium]